MENILDNQEQIISAMEQLFSSFKKTGRDRRTADYIKRKLETLGTYWNEFEGNHSKLCQYGDQSASYFQENRYDQVLSFYNNTKAQIQQCLPRITTPGGPEDIKQLPTPSPGMPGTSGMSSQPPKRSQGFESKTDEMLRMQASNFKAFSRTVNDIDLEAVSEKWEFEDLLQELQSRWSAIDCLHWQLDSILDGENEEYEKTFSANEKSYKLMKKMINSKLWSSSHRENSTPKMDIPIFSGNYHQWVPFKDLFVETIHSNRSLSGAQKMQFLKSKLKGEAERLIQHLYISTENYQVCWDILNHRYNNTKLIFNSHMHIIFSLPILQQQSATPIKRMFDVTNECLNAVKNLGVDISTWDPLVVYILSQKLDSQTHNEYTDFLKHPRNLPKLSDFMEFLENKFTSLESSRRKQDSIKSQQETNYKKPSFYKHYNENNKFNNNSATKNHKPWSNKCLLCNEQHYLFNCKTFLDSSPDMKYKTINRLNLCKNCLYDHKGKTCYSTKRCRYCQGNHNTLLHDTRSPASTSSNYNTGPSTTKEQRNSVTHVSNNKIIETLLATAEIKIKAANGSYINIRALIDQGSQLSLISENAAQRLGLSRQACKGVIFGVGTKSNNCKGVINVEASAVHNNFSFQGDLFIMKNLINNLPNKSFSKLSFDCLESIQLADPRYNVSRPIDVLLGVDIYSLIIMGGLIKEPESQLVAQQTRLGWILSGNVRSYQCNVVLNNVDDMQRFWAIEDISESNCDMSVEDYQCIQQYKKETTRRADGHYVVRLPLKPDIKEKLGDSRQKAIAQFYQLERKLSKNNNIQTDYKAFMNEYINLGHMKQSAIKNKQSCYLPHHCVLRSDSSTTALRVVFNASAKTLSGFSLNDLMFCGPNLQQDLFTLILRWRQYEFAFTADIEKMFRQIFCHQEDSQYQKIIWRDSPNQKLCEYELMTVTYGTKAAPFLAMMTLKQLADDERPRYPHAARALEEDFYMDDLLSGHHSLQAAKQLQQELIELLKSGGFNLRKWSSNKSELLNDLSKTENVFDFKHQQSTKTLGLQWHPNEDQFTFQSKIKILSSTSITKRSLLSDISKIFDPLGWLSPLTTKLKLLFQRVWQLQLQWDDQVPENIVTEWLLITRDLQNINKFKLPRWLECRKETKIELHGFCDSSSKAYASVIYCKIKKDNNQASIILVTGKARLVPLAKNITLPRLELSAALLLSKLMNKVLKSLTGYNINVFAWSDSTAVLGWLQGDHNRWKPFVTNRVKQITSIIPTENWRYVKSADNPADCASRGMLVEQLAAYTLWWQGPKWLPLFNEHEESKERPNYTTSEEIKISSQINVITQKCNNNIINTLLNKCSNFTKATRVLVWILRALSTSKKGPFLTITELRKAKCIIIKHIQHCEFPEDIKSLHEQGKVNSKSKLLNLNPYLDKDGLMRVGGRLSNARIDQNMQHPLIIPHSGHLTNLLIDQGHKMTYHGGTRLTLAWLRQEFWILGGNRAVKKRLHNCITCRRHSPIKHTQMMGDLPASRSNPTRPFHHTGVDFTGFVEIKSNKGRGIKTTKGYISVFVCMATKAVHLELVSDLSSSSFLAALRRMSARRGAPKHIYSDNGTNFVGASRILKEEYVNLKKTLDNEFYTTITDMQIQWHFNAPSWPNAGGLWEAAVKSLKYHIKRVIGEQKLTYEEYSTLLAQLEACLNSRPLCSLSEDPEDMNYLTPSHFLASGPTLTIVETEKDARTRWQLTQKIFNDIWKRWTAEYLCQLSARSKWRQKQYNLQLNDIVTINDANLPPGKWALGRIIQQHPGEDGLVRVVTLKTKNGIIKRPINKLSLLPVNENQSLSPDTKEQDQIACETIQSTTVSDNKTFKQKGKLKKVCHMIYLALMFLILIIAPATCEYTITSLNTSQSIYFDKISDMRLERDEWKIIVYYDLQPYWEGSELLNKYIKHLDSMCSNRTKVSQCDVILMQLRHGRNELDHYNSMLFDRQFIEGKRHKRGLLNIVGTAAHSLFGVLDEEFAQQYQKDIELIRNNQKHLSLLWKKQTSIIEADNNVIKRVEDTMYKHHKIFNQHLITLEKRVNTVNEQIQESLIANSFSTSSIIANNVLINLKTVQETLLETITNVQYGRFNIHLLTPEQLSDELSIISGQLGKDLTLPINNIQIDLAKIYHLLRVRTRFLKKYVIFEIKIPLVSRDSYDLHQIITIPQQAGDHMISIIPIANHIAMNIRKDAYIPMSEKDVQNCLHFDTSTRICSLRRPIFQLRSDENLCVKEQHSNQCKTTSTVCTNSWTELDVTNTYLYFCCGQCTVRVICEDQVTAELLSKAGIITLGNECVIKGNSYTIYSHKKLSNSLNVKADVVQIEIPPINHVFNLSIPITPIEKYIDHDHREREERLKQVEKQLHLMKEEENISEPLSYHDIHHYTVIYVVVSGAVLAAAVYLWRRVRRVRSATLAAPQEHQLQSAISVQCMSECEQPGARSARTQNQATSPVFFKPVFSANE